MDMPYDIANAPGAQPAIQMPMVGGFKPLPATSAEARTATATALKLVRTVGELETMSLARPEIVKVEAQTVAGRNYRVAVRVGEADDRHLLQVLYYQDLKGRLRLNQVYFDGEPIMATD